MVVERSEITVTPGLEMEFEAAMGHCRSLLTEAKGCRSVRLARGVENPSKYLLLLEWDAVQDHVAFTRSPEFQQFREAAGPFFAAKPAMEHFEPVSGKCPITRLITGLGLAGR